MSFNVNFYKFNKKPNSTKQPDGLTPTTFLCDFWGSFDMSAPVLKVEAGMDVITKYTYCEIPIWGKLYFVETYGWNSGFVTVTLTPDVLGTYKSFITAREQFFIRTTVKSFINPLITDTAYPPYANTATRHIDIAEIYSANGTYVVETAGQLGNVFYGMHRDQFANLMSWFFTQPSDNFWKTLVTTTAENMLGTFVDPMSYIASCYYVPIYVNWGMDTTVKLGYWDSGVPAATLTPSADLSSVPNFKIFTVPDSYYVTDECEYLNYDPYCTATLYLPFSGSYPLSLSSGRVFYISYSVDIKGNIFYEVKRYDGSSGLDTVLQATGKCGMPVGYSKNTIDLNSVIAGASNIVGGIASAFEGNFGAIGTVGSSVANTVGSLVPHNSFGARTCPGTADKSKITLTLEQTRIGPGASNYGYPSYKNGIPSVRGWYKCLDAKIDWVDEMYEYDKTKDYMDNGFFVE